MNFNLKGSLMVKAMIVGAIAVVLILAVIIFISITSSKKSQQEGLNDIIKGNLAIALTNGVLYLDQQASFKGFCEDDYFKEPATIISADGGSAMCNVKSDNKAWCGCATLKTTSFEPAGSTFCVDSRGYKRITQNIGGCDARCTSSGICID